MDDERLARCGANIAAQIGRRPSGCALVVASPGKRAIAAAAADALRHAGLEAHALWLGPRVDTGATDLHASIRGLTPRWGLALLVQPEHAAFLFGLTGRPDQGLILPSEHLFCDWLIAPGSLVRILDVELAEQERFRVALLRALQGARSLHVTSPAGTDLRLTPRTWISTEGEVFTAPMEESVEGRLVVDGAAYDRPAQRCFTLHLEGGWASDLDALDETDTQQRMARNDLSRDPCAHRVAEFGLGVSLGADTAAGVMEAEQARGTCHLGFGANRAFGGANDCRYHVDFCVRAPTIRADGRVIYQAGRYALPGWPE